MRLNIRIIIRILSTVMLLLSLSMLPSMCVSLLYGESSVAKAFAACIVPIALLSILLIRMSNPDSSSIRTRDGILIVALCWIFGSVISAFPYIVSGAIPNFADAFFESASGLSTTGSTILQDIEVLPRGILFWRSFTHWLGGMGILVLAIALLPAIGVGAFHIAEAETSGPSMDKLSSKTYNSSRILYIIYIGMTAVETILLLFGGMDLFDALVHSFGSVATGGFSPYNDSIGHFGSLYIQMVVSLFSLMAGVNFHLYYLLFLKNTKGFFRDGELRAYLSIICAATLLLTAVLFGFGTAGSIGEALQLAFFQTVSIITTTGYCTTDFSLWPTAGMTILFLLFFVGGCSSSTSGSVKVVRIVVFMKLIRRGIYKRLHPTAVVPVKLGDRNLSSPVVSNIASFLFLYLTLFLLGTLLISIDSPDLITAASSVAACLGNIGPGLGEAGPVSNFSFYSDGSTLFLAMLMIIGRLELFTILLLFFPGFWNPDR